MLQPILDVLAALALRRVYLVSGVVIRVAIIAVLSNGAVIAIAIAGCIRIIFFDFNFFIHEEGDGEEAVLLLQQVVLDQLNAGIDTAVIVVVELEVMTSILKFVILIGFTRRSVHMMEADGIAITGNEFTLERFSHWFYQPF